MWEREACYRLPKQLKELLYQKDCVQTMLLNLFRVCMYSLCKQEAECVYSQQGLLTHFEKFLHLTATI